jgi:hypothetical protein
MSEDKSKATDEMGIVDKVWLLCHPTLQCGCEGAGECEVCREHEKLRKLLNTHARAIEERTIDKCIEAVEKEATYDYNDAIPGAIQALTALKGASKIDQACEDERERKRENETD